MSRWLTTLVGKLVRDLILLAQLNTHKDIDPAALPEDLQLWLDQTGYQDRSGGGADYRGLAAGVGVYGLCTLTSILGLEFGVEGAGLLPAC